jgi:hypothetical protein
MFSLILQVGAFVCFCVGAANFPTPPRPNWISLGLALWMLSILIHAR